MQKIGLSLCGFLLCLLESQPSQACDYTGAWRIIQDNGPVVEIHIQTTDSKPFGVAGSDGGTLGSIEMLLILQPPAYSYPGLIMEIRWKTTKGNEDRRDGQLAGYWGRIWTDGTLHGATWTRDTPLVGWHSDKAFKC